ncbi:MAG: tRNA preQ1(34) S-adenosylmethionine ribosyltransferase-isomerase QueA [Kiritimatiellae bacterium]|nr:tRNA preQ1(34) S-adenosylmethionine ribosyltransferase-isomerase QueA [Kiritimatiellia bacterium]
MLVSDFDYELPPELIAQTPPEKRGGSRMMVLPRAPGGAIRHCSIADFPSFLAPGDLVVFNDTRVFSARAEGRWEDTPGRVEVLFVEPSAVHPGAWTALCKSSRPMKPGRVAVLAGGALRATVVGKDDATGRVEFSLAYDGDFFELLDRTGTPPVPPYIKRGPGDPRVALDRERYQTVYARETGAVAAPTAGLHFSEELLRRIDETGARRAFVTLHVGPGTFRPVKTDTVEAHVMDSERCEVPEETARLWRETREKGGRVFAVGSTSVRTLETVAAAHDGRVEAWRGRSSIFIYPPYRFLAVDAMLTNFHLPRSTLLMMVSAFAGRERAMAAYEAAIAARYRFYSYGDCMLML